MNLIIAGAILFVVGFICEAVLPRPRPAIYVPEDYNSITYSVKYRNVSRDGYELQVWKNSDKPVVLVRQFVRYTE